MEGRVEPAMVDSVCTNTRIYGMVPVNVSVNELSYMARSSTEAVYTYSKWKN